MALFRGNSCPFWHFEKSKLNVVRTMVCWLQKTLISSKAWREGSHRHLASSGSLGRDGGQRSQWILCAKKEESGDVSENALCVSDLEIDASGQNRNQKFMQVRKVRAVSIKLLIFRYHNTTGVIKVLLLRFGSQ